MHLQYSLDENDFLLWRLYIASKSKKIKRTRLLDWFCTPLVCLGLGLSFYAEDKVKHRDFVIFLFLLGIIWIIFFPLYNKNRYVRHYKKKITEEFKNFPKEANENLIITDSYLEATSNLRELKYSLTQVKEIIETNAYFYINLIDMFAIIPKSKINSVDEVRTELQSIAVKLNIPFVSELDWKWK